MRHPGGWTRHPVAHAPGGQAHWRVAGQSHAAGQARGRPAAAQLVALNVWCTPKPKTRQLGAAGQVASGDGRSGPGPEQPTKRGKDEDHHLYHTKGWCRELAIEALGLPAVLPPPEEVKNVETAIGASRAEQQRESML